MNDKIPIIATYRGIGIHNHQPPAWIELVKTAIDQVAAMSNILELADYAADVRGPPEARLYAANKVEVQWDLATERRENRPDIDLDRVRASVAGLDSVDWRNPFAYCSLLDAWHDDNAVEREQPLKG